MPIPPRGWGVTAPLWGLSAPDTPGFGDFDDLRRTGEALGKTGAGFLGINPIHACFPTEATWASPYSASHRRRLNPLHIATGPGVATGPLVDYAREIPAKRAALRAAYDTFAGDPAFDTWTAQEGDDLTRFARPPGPERPLRRALDRLARPSAKPPKGPGPTPPNPRSATTRGCNGWRTAS